MSYCVNLNCQQPQNPDDFSYCQSCSANLHLHNRYTIIKRLGTSAMSRTFLAWDDPRKTHCVIKQFTSQAWKTSNLGEISNRFQQEVERLNELGRHSQIPSLIDSFSQGVDSYLVQRFIEGWTLEQELSQQGKFTEVKVWQLLNDFLPVLDYIHRQDVIHRDIKPENLIRRRSDNKIVLVDFGAAKIATPSQRRGTVIGSPGYAAPEQTFGNATQASDIYSLGLTCLHLLTEMEPLDLFSQDGCLVWRDFLIDNPVSTSLGEILEKMTQLFLQFRYSSTSELLEILKEQRQTSSKSGIRHTLDSLTVKQKNFLYKQVFPDAIPFLPGRLPAPSQIVEEIYQFLEAAASCKEKGISVTEKTILQSWLGEIDSILKDLLEKNKNLMKLKPRVDLIFNEIRYIKQDDNRAGLDDRLEAIVRNIIFLMIDSLDEKEEKVLSERIKEELEKNSVSIAGGKLTKEGIKSILIGGAGLPAIALPIASGIILQQVTQGFMGWIVIHLLAIVGIKPLEVVLLGFFAGPAGWVIAGAGVLAGVGFAATKFKDKKKEILFIETVFSIYSYRYQNRLQSRGW